MGRRSRRRRSPSPDTDSRAPGGDIAASGAVREDAGVTEAVDDGTRTQRHVAAIVLLAVVALALRVPGLTTHDLYRDDAWPALATITGLRDTVRIGVTIPGFEVLLRAWLGVSHATLWAQAPFLIASVAAVVLVYLLCRRLRVGATGALAAGAVLALSPVSVLTATRVKQYSFDVVHALLVIAIAIAVAQRPGSWRRWAALAGVSVVVIVFSASVLPVTLAAVVFALIAAVRHAARPVAAFFAAGSYGLFVVAWTLVVLPEVPPPLRHSWDENYVHHESLTGFLGDTWHVLDEFAAGIYYRHGPTGPIILAVLVVVVALSRRHLVILLLGPVAIALALAAAERVPLGGGRIDAYLYPGVALATGVTLDWVLSRVPALVHRPNVGQLALGAAIVVFAATTGRHHATSNDYPSADVSVLDDALRARRQPGDAIVVSQFSRYAYALYTPLSPRLVFSDDYSTGFTVASRDPDVFIMPAEYYEGGYDPDAALRFAGDRRRVWYIATDSPPLDTPPDIQRHEYEAEERMLAAGFRVIERIPAHGAHADLLVRN